MKLLIMAKTFRSVNAPPFWIAGEMLNADAPNFGPSPAMLYFRPHFHDELDFFGMPGLLEGYTDMLSKMPRVRVLNHKQLVEIDYVSNVCLGEYFLDPYDDPLNTPFALAQIAKMEEQFGPQTPGRPFDAELFRRFCTEFLGMLPTFKSVRPVVDVIPNSRPAWFAK